MIFRDKDSSEYAKLWSIFLIHFRFAWKKDLVITDNITGYKLCFSGDSRLGQAVTMCWALFQTPGIQGRKATEVYHPKADIMIFIKNAETQIVAFVYMQIF